MRLQHCPVEEEAKQRIIRLPERDDDADQSNDSQTNAYHSGRDGENMDADVLLEMSLLISFSPRNRFHGIPDLDRTRNWPFILD